MENGNFVYKGWKCNGFLALVLILGGLALGVYAIVAGAQRIDAGLALGGGLVAAMESDRLAADVRTWMATPRFLLVAWLLYPLIRPLFGEWLMGQGIPLPYVVAWGITIAEIIGFAKGIDAGWTGFARGDRSGTL